jgi:shikimate dehydrogenase
MGTVILLGRHIGYSASPAMHAAAFRALGLGHSYRLADVAADELPSVVAGLRAADSLGANVTTPHKAAVLELLDEVDPLGRRAGAVNTITRRDGRLVGSNTDVPAIADEIHLLRPAPARVVVLGAGGAGRAVGLALEMVGAREVTFVTRSGSAGSVGWERLPDLLPVADLLVNATPVGTDSDDSPADAGSMHAGLAVLDLVYRPSPSRLVTEARARGAPARSLEAWLSAPIEMDVRRAMAGALRAELGDAADV